MVVVVEVPELVVVVEEPVLVVVVVVDEPFPEVEEVDEEEVVEEESTLEMFEQAPKTKAKIRTGKKYFFINRLRFYTGLRLKYKSPALFWLVTTIRRN